MRLGDQQPAARLDEVFDDGGPAVEVGEPVERADPGVNQVELLIERPGRRITSYNVCYTKLLRLIGKASPQSFPHYKFFFGLIDYSY